MLKLEDGTGRAVRPTIAAIRTALEGPTSIVCVAGTEITISLDTDNDEVDVSDGVDFYATFETADVKQAILQFLALAEEV